MNRFKNLILIFLLFWGIAVFSGYPFKKNSAPRGPSIAEQIITKKLILSSDFYGGLIGNLEMESKLRSNFELPIWNPYVGMGKTLYGDGINYGSLNPLRWIADLIADFSLSRSMAVLSALYVGLLIICCMLLFHLATGHAIGGAPFSLLLLSSGYFSQAGNSAFGAHNNYLTLFGALIFLLWIKKGHWKEVFLSAIVMGWFLTTARADSYIYFGLMFGIFLLVECANSLKTKIFEPLGRYITFFTLSVTVSMVWLLPNKIMGSNSARGDVPHIGHGIDFLNGFKTFILKYMAADYYSSGLNHRVLILIFAFFGIFALKNESLKHLRFFGIGGWLLLLGIVSGVFDTLFLRIGFDMQPVPYSMLADVFTFSLAIVGVASFSSKELGRERLVAYIGPLLVLFFYSKYAPDEKILIPIIVFFLIILILETYIYSQKFALATSSRLVNCLIFIAAVAVLAGNGPFYFLFNNLKEEYFRWASLGLLGLGSTLYFLSIRLKKLKFSFSIKSGLFLTYGLLAGLISPTPFREISAIPVEDWKVPDEVSAYFDSENFRTLNLIRRDANTGLPLYSYATANSPLSFLMYSPLHPYLETSGGHSVASKYTAELTDIINYGYLWHDSRNWRHQYHKAWIEQLDAGSAKAFSGDYRILVNMRKSTVVFNGTSPFLKFTGTKYVVSPQKLEETEFLKLIEQVENLKTYGRSFVPKVYEPTYYIYEVVNTYPRILVPEQVLTAPTIEQTVELMRSAKGTTAVLLADENKKLEVNDGKILSARFSASEVNASVAMNGPGYLLLNDGYFPGWRAWVNGNEVKIVRANINFRAVELPKGLVEVRFKFTAPGFNLGAIISLLALVTCGVGFFFSRRLSHQHS